MDSFTSFGDDGIETVMVIGSVMYGSNGAIRFMYRVVTFNYIAISSFFLRLDVSSVRIMDAIVELVFRRCLNMTPNINII